MTTTGPAPADVQILHFKQLFKLITRHDVSKSTYQKPTSLIAVSSLHGLTFVGEKNALKVIATFKLYNETQNLDVKILDQYHHRVIPLPASPTHIDLNAEQKLLAVVFIHDDVPLMRIFVVDSFLNEEKINFTEIRLSSTAATHLTDLSWNPVVPNVFACCISDGSLSTYTYNASNNFEVNSLPKESCSVCVCWSPKGKQIVVGNYNGYLTQYLPELKAVKNVPPPTGLFPKACSLVSIKWISNFQFIGAYKTQENNVADDEEIKTCIVVVNTPKNGSVQYINYDDVCFSGGSERPVQFYFNHIPSWNLIFVSSSNSLEVAALGLSQDKQTWIPWNLEPEEVRITLPYPPSGEAFPVGVAIDFGVTFQVAIVGEEPVHYPTLSVMTCQGILCIYLINYLDPAAPKVCSPASGLASLQYFTSELITDDAPLQDQPTVAEHAQESPSGDLSGITYNISQSAAQIQEVMSSVDTTAVNAPEPQSVLGSETLNVLSSEFNFGTTLAKHMGTETTNTPSARASINFSQDTKSEPALTSRSVEQGTLSVSSSEVTSVGKKSEPPKSRGDAVKRLKKRASIFENDIQEIKYLVNNINLGSSEPRLHASEKFATLENISAELTSMDKDLRQDVDSLRTSVIEVFARVQEVKSKLFQLMNPGYQSLTGAQDIDSISSNSLKSVESSMNYVRVQVDKANKELEEIWFKFSQQNCATRTTKVPVLENVYETMLKQQKILHFIKLQTEKLEERFKTIIHRLSREGRHISADKKVPWSIDKLLNENMSLDDLTKKALNLDSDAELHPKQLASKYSREYAKRFHLSYVKQVKLQELHNTSGVTYIQSSRLQRLKKKSLIILSKKTSEPDVIKEETVPKHSEPYQITAISPVSSEDETLNRVVSSTPVKGEGMPRFAMENTLPMEPSIIAKPTTSAPPKFVPPTATDSSSTMFSMPEKAEGKSSESDKPKTQQPVAVTTKPEKTTPAATLPEPTSAPAPFVKPVTENTSFFGPSLLTGKLPPTTTSAPSKFFQQPIAAVSSTVVSTSSTPLFSGIGSSISSAPSTQAPQLPSFGSGSFFSLVSSSAPTISSSAGLTAPSTSFSFAPPMAQASTTTVSSSLATTPAPSSIFAGKSLQTSTTSSTDPVKVALPGLGTLSNVIVSGSSGESMFKAIATTTSALPSFESPAVGPVNTGATATPSQGLSASIIATLPSTIPKPATTSSASIFGNASIFGKSDPTTGSSIIGTLNFGDMLSSSTFAKNKPVGLSAATDATVAAGQKSSAFSSFSFASKSPGVSSSVTITEVTNDEEKDSDKENVGTAPATSPPHSYASSPPSLVPISTTQLMFSGTSSSSSQSSHASVSTTHAVHSATPPSSNSPLAANEVSASLTPPFSPKASAADSTAGTAFSSTAPAAAFAVTTAPVAPSAAASSAGGVVDNAATSFFGNLKLGATSSAAEGASTNLPIFGKAPLASSASSLFSGSGRNIFSQAADSTAASTTIETKPIFGKGAVTPLFGQNAAGTIDNKSVFGSPSSGGSFQTNAGSSFTGGGSIFGGNSTFGSAATTQASTFGSTSGGSMFGTNFTSSFQSTTGGFGSPPSFPVSSQQQQSPIASGSGFGAPATFSNVFQKPASAFPAFGNTPTFGGSPAFGTSPGKVFGESTANMSTFGSGVTQQPTTFDTLASDNTLTFGNLAQQQPSGFGSPASFGSPNNNPTFGSGSNFGSSSFSSWR